MPVRLYGRDALATSRPLLLSLPAPVVPRLLFVSDFEPEDEIETAEFERPYRDTLTFTVEAFDCVSDCEYVFALYKR